MGGAWAVGFAALLGIAILPRRGQVMPNAHRALVAALAGMLALTAIGLALAQTAEGSKVPRDTAELVRVSWPCVAAGLLVALVPLAGGLIALRRAVPMGARALGATLGAAGGALGGFALHLHCAWATPLHVGFAHGLPIALAALIGALLAPAVLEP